MHDSGMTSLGGDVTVNEKTISDIIQYKKFLSLIKMQEYLVDLSYMNEHKIKVVSPELIHNFNSALLSCKREYNYSLLSILTKLSEEFMDTTKIKRYISTEVKWELIDEVRHNHPGIKEEFPDNDNNDLLFM
jgi:hypothetical protein